MRSGEEIQGGLRRFVARWRDYSGSERSEAQTFLNELIQCYGADRKMVGARFEDAHTATGIMDLQAVDEEGCSGPSPTALLRWMT